MMRGLRAANAALRAVVEARAAENALLRAELDVPPERAARLVGMLLGPEVAAGQADKASARLSARPGGAGFEEAMLAALASKKVLAPTRPRSASWTGHSRHTNLLQLTQPSGQVKRNWQLPY